MTFPPNAPPFRMRLLPIYRLDLERPILVRVGVKNVPIGPFE